MISVLTKAFSEVECTSVQISKELLKEISERKGEEEEKVGKSVCLHP